jgi:hypothetical protein
MARFREMRGLAEHAKERSLATGTSGGARRGRESSAPTAPTSIAYRRCPVCDRFFQVRADGKLRRHGGNAAKRCAGSLALVVVPVQEGA